MSKNYAIMRVKKLKTGSQMAGMTNHNQRNFDVPNADKDISNYNSHFSISKTNDIKTDIYTLLEANDVKVKPDSVLALEYMITFSPNFAGFDKFKDENGNWKLSNRKPGDYDRWKQFQDLTFKWLEKEYGNRLVNYSIHLDESTPHLHAYVVPLVQKEVKWKNKKGSGSTKKWVLDAKSYTNGRKVMSAMQDRFYSSVGQPLGLERGIKGSKAKHEKVKTYYGRIRRAIEMDQAPEQFVKSLSMNVGLRFDDIQANWTSTIMNGKVIKEADFKAYKDELFKYVKNVLEEKDNYSEKVKKELMAHYGTAIMEGTNRDLWKANRDKKKAEDNLKIAETKINKAIQDKEVLSLDTKNLSKALQKISVGQFTPEDMSRILPLANKHASRNDDLNQGSSIKLS